MRLGKKMLCSVLLCAAVLVVNGCGKKDVKKAVRERSSRVTVEKLQKRTFQRRIPLQGTVSPVEHAVISAKISGTLELLKVDEGDTCKAGDVLFGIDRQILKNQVVVKEDEIKVKEAELKSAEFRLRTAEISQRQAAIDYERAKTLKESSAISQANFESYDTAYKKAEMEVRNAQAEVINAQAQLKQSQSNLAIAKKNLDDSVIRAPFDCVVFDKYVEENEYVTAGKNILKLENHRQFEVVCYISAIYFDQITVGKTVVDFNDLSGRNAGRGVVTYKAPGVDPSTRTFKLKAIVPPNVPAVSGMLCELSVILEEKEAYGLPTETFLLRANNRYIAYTINAENRAESVVVQRGIADSGYTEVLNADKLMNKNFVTSGQTFINNGSLLDVVKR